MTIRFRAASTAAMALVLGLSMAAAGCGKYSVGTLKAIKAFKDGNLAYAQKDWKKAVEKYETVVAHEEAFVQVPQLTVPPQPSLRSPQSAPTPAQVFGTHASVERPASEMVSSSVFCASLVMVSEAPSGPSVAGAVYVTVTSTRSPGWSTEGVSP